MGRTTRRIADRVSHSYMSSSWPRGAPRKQDRAGWHSYRNAARGARGAEDMPYTPRPSHRIDLRSQQARCGLSVDRLWPWGHGRNECDVCGVELHESDARPPHKWITHELCLKDYHLRVERRGSAAPFRGHRAR